MNWIYYYFEMILFISSIASNLSLLVLNGYSVFILVSIDVVIFSHFLTFKLYVTLCSDVSLVNNI